jgi:dTDP-4-amino-4,6-dideoxygalactose transaminase
MNDIHPPVPLLDLTRTESELNDKLRHAFERVLRSGHFILGPEVEALEAEIASYCGAKYAVGVSSGTDALLVSLMALGIAPGDEVLCPTYTFFATAGCVSRVGAKPVFVDCNPTTFNAEAHDFEPFVTSRTKAVIAVHLFGLCCEMNPILDLCTRRGIPLIEDAAQALGARDRGRGAGSMGTLGCFSFFPSKNLGCLGDGGMIVTNDAALAEKCRLLRGHGAKPKYYHKLVGGNFRLDALQAAFLREKLPYLEGWTLARQKNADHYRTLFANAGLTVDKIVLPSAPETHRHIFNQFVIRVTGEGQRDALKKHLEKHRIGTEIYYPVPMHLQECFQEHRRPLGSLPNAEAAARETLAIPIFPGLRPDEQEFVVGAIASFFGSSQR